MGFPYVVALRWNWAEGEGDRDVKDQAQSESN